MESKKQGEDGSESKKRKIGSPVTAAADASPISCDEAVMRQDEGTQTNPPAVPSVSI